MKKVNELIEFETKAVDDILFAGQNDVVNTMILEMKQSYELGKIEFGTGNITFFGLQLTQDEYECISVHADEKLNRKELDVNKAMKSSTLSNYQHFIPSTVQLAGS